MNLLSIDFPFRPQGNLLIRKTHSIEIRRFKPNSCFAQKGTMQTIALLNILKISKKNAIKQLRNTNYSNGKEKHEKTTLQKKNWTQYIEDPQNNDSIEDQGGSRTTPLNNCLGAMF